MSKEVVEKVFNGFYTSKESGTGLGLMMVKRIVNGHGGKIELESQVNKGTKVSRIKYGIRLPRVR